MKIELFLDNNKVIAVEDQSFEIKEFLKKIQDKYPDWEEFILSNHASKQIRLLKLKDSIICLDKTLLIGKLIMFLDGYYRGWIRMGITKNNFPVVGGLVFQKGMLTRLSSSNTNQYNFITGVEGDTVKCFQEGKNWEFSMETFNKKNYKYKLLCTNLANEKELLSIDWPELKTRKPR